MNNYKIFRHNNRFYTFDLKLLEKYKKLNFNQEIINIKNKINKNTLQKLKDLIDELNKNIQLTNDKNKIIDLINTHNKNIISLYKYSEIYKKRRILRLITTYNNKLKNVINKLF